MVKCEAYGHGGRVVSKYTEDIVDYFGVATVIEGVELRQGGILKPILVTNFDFNESELAVKYGLTVAVYNDLQIENLASHNKEVDVHIKVDSGMNRLGVKTKNELDIVIKKCLNCQNIKVKGAFSHLYSTSKSSILAQNKKFFLMLNQIKQNYPNVIGHLKASSGVFLTNEYCYDMVRIGLAGYGYSAYHQYLHKALYVVGKVKALKKVKKGEVISYDGIFTAPYDMTIAIVSGGYGDGINRKQKQVIIGNKVCNIVGKICMDMLMVEVEKSTKVGDEVLFLGAKGHNEYYANTIAKEIDTISYEVLTNYHNRIERVYFL